MAKKTVAKKAVTENKVSESAVTENVTEKSVSENSAVEEQKSETSETSVNIVKNGFDPKNREVLMLSDKVNGKSIYVVTKVDTRYSSDPVSKKMAESIFEHQINCSQNQ